MSNKIKFLIMDVDGTLTDGKIYMGNDGELFKAFDIKDGCGIKDLLPLAEITPIIITARTSKILQNRCKELSIENLHQGVHQKLEKLDDILKQFSEKNNETYTYGNCAYIGDDILDLQCMVPIKEAGGIVGCPSDAVKKVKDVSDYVCENVGGNGAVREFIEYLVEGKNCFS